MYIADDIQTMLAQGTCKLRTLQPGQVTLPLLLHTLHGFPCGHSTDSYRCFSSSSLLGGAHDAITGWCLADTARSDLDPAPPRLMVRAFCQIRPSHLLSALCRFASCSVPGQSMQCLAIFEIAMAAGSRCLPGWPSGQLGQVLAQS